MRVLTCCMWLVSAAAFGWQGAHSAPLGLELRIPKQRPYLALTPADLVRAGERVGRFGWAKEVRDKLVNEANASVAAPWGKLPPKGDDEHAAIGRRLFGVALAYAFTGERKYAEWTRDGLVAYASIYPGLPLSNLRVKLFLPRHGPLFEAMWVVSVAQAYDMVADSGVFSGEQKRLVENDLLRASMVCFKVDDFENDPRIKDLHYRCYNFQAWHISAIGLVGLVLRDRDLVDYAVNSRYGLRHLIAHDIRDDGMFWERSAGYHRFVMTALLPFTEAMLHCGVDLYGVKVANDRSRDEDQHYVTDTSDKPKSLRLMWEAPFYLCFPDLTYPALGDSDRGPLRGGWEQLVGYQRYREPKLAWLVGREMEAAPVAERRPVHDWHFLIHDLPPSSPVALPVKDGTFANTGQYRNGCSLFPSTGVAVLRSAGGDFTSRPDATAVTLSYGPYGGGHGHPDKLNMVVYAQGRQWIPDFGSMQYYTHWKADWTSQTVSHNNLVVDGISQRPAGARNIEWPADTAADRVLGKLERFDPRSLLASASCDRLYDGFKMSRTVRLDGDCVVDDYVAEPTSASPSAHQFDYVLHIDGELESSSAPLAPRSGKLGERLGYQLIDQKQGLKASGVVSFTFAAGSKKLRVWMVPAGKSETEAIVAEGLTNSPDVRKPMLVLRRKGERARFLTVIEPVPDKGGLRAVRLDSGSSGEPAALILEDTIRARRVPLR
ncbi:MAG TPA: heparinase II/III family protein [Bryobacteraceae bacterium]|nr:heparinase II/III family protein [Bryobacteraceae bacterium]